MALPLNKTRTKTVGVDKSNSRSSDRPITLSVFYVSYDDRRKHSNQKKTEGHLHAENRRMKKFYLLVSSTCSYLSTDPFFDEILVKRPNVGGRMDKCYKLLCSKGRKKSTSTASLIVDTDPVRKTIFFVTCGRSCQQPST